jgi:23S rRNA pseudouridine2605 synthase/23S rRNA pseudouridine2604 synthase
MEPIRLQKYLSQAGVCSRRKGEQFIREGRVTVNGRVVTQLGTKVDPAVDRVSCDGKPVPVGRQLLYIALNKPAGVVSSCDHPGEKTVVDLVGVGQRVVPVGRLDKETTGLLLMTNDGHLHHRLSHPSFDHEKEYDVTLEDRITDGALKKLAQGLPLMGRRTRRAKVKRISERRFRITLQEGRNRQIRRMVRKVGSRVVRLNRTRIACIELGALQPGQWRHLEKEEVEKLQKLVAPGP